MSGRIGQILKLISLPGHRVVIVTVHRPTAQKNTATRFKFSYMINQWFNPFIANNDLNSFNFILLAEHCLLGTKCVIRRCLVLN